MRHLFSSTDDKHNFSDSKLLTVIYKIVIKPKAQGFRRNNSGKTFFMSESIDNFPAWLLLASSQGCSPEGLGKCQLGVYGTDSILTKL